MKVKLGDVATYINGYAFKPEDWSDSGLPIIRIQDLTGNSYKTNRFSGKYDKKFEVNDGDILISWSASIGVYIWRGEKAVLNQHIFKVKFDKQVNICKKFFIYQVENILKKAILETHGATMKHLTKPVFDSLPFYLPDIKKQNEISAILDKISEIISLRQQQLKKLDELVKSRFIEMFGDTVLNPYNWKKDLLGMVCDVRDGTHDSPQYYEIGYPLVTSKNVTAGIIDLSDCSLISEEDYNKINERSKVDIGDIIMPMIGTVGKPVIVNVEPNFAIKNVSLIKFKKESKVLNIYIRAFLQSDYFDDAVLSKLRGGTQKFISLGDIRNLEVLMPPIELQNEFADFVKQTDKSNLEIQKSLDKLEILKKSLMQQYFE